MLTDQEVQRVFGHADGDPAASYLPAGPSNPLLGIVAPKQILCVQDLESHPPTVMVPFKRHGFAGQNSIASTTYVARWAYNLWVYFPHHFIAQLLQCVPSAALYVVVETIDFAALNALATPSVTAKRESFDALTLLLNEEATRLKAIFRDQLT